MCLNCILFITDHSASFSVIIKLSYHQLHSCGILLLPKHTCITNNLEVTTLNNSSMTIHHFILHSKMVFQLH